MSASTDAVCGGKVTAWRGRNKLCRHAVNVYAVVVSKLLAQVATAVRVRKLFPRNAKILVAVSGGVDSVALLHVLHALAPTHLSIHRVQIERILQGLAARENPANSQQP